MSIIRKAINIWSVWNWLQRLLKCPWPELICSCFQRPDKMYSAVILWCINLRGATQRQIFRYLTASTRVGSMKNLSLSRKHWMFLGSLLPFQSKRVTTASPTRKLTSCLFFVSCTWFNLISIWNVWLCKSVCLQIWDVNGDGFQC